MKKTKNFILAEDIVNETDYKKRWRKIHDLLGKTNPKALKEQKAQERALKKVRESKVYEKKEKGAMGLKFGVSVPRMTWQAIVGVDEMLDGKSRLFDTAKKESKDRSATNGLVQDLREVFPEYRVN